MKKEKINTIILLGIFLLYLTAYCCGPIYALLKDIFLVINFVITFILLVINIKSISNDSKVKFIISLQLLILFFCEIATHTGLGSILQMLNLSVLLLMIPGFKININFYKVLKIMMLIFFMVFIFVPKQHLNPNYVGYIFLCSYIICVILFKLFRKENNITLIVFSFITLLLIYSYECRTAMLGLILMFIMLQLPLKIYKNKIIKLLLPYILVFFSFLFAIFYIFLWRHGLSVDLRPIVDKGIFSGRNRIWFELLPLIFKNPFLGLGSNYQLSSHFEFATHNTVFMIAATFGIPCLILFFVNVKNIIKNIYSKINSNYILRLAIVSITTLFMVDVFESYIYWSLFNYFFFVIMVLIFNYDLENKSKNNQYTIYIFEEGIDRMGGVERVVSTLSNEFSKDCMVNVISFYKTAKQPFFKYSDKVNITYLLSNRVQKSKSVKNKTIKYYFFRALEMFEDKVNLERKIAKVTQKINENDIVILGRLEVALHVIPYLDTPKKTIVRDAIHYLYYRKGMQRKIKYRLPGNITTLIVSSDESKKVYDNIFKGKNINVKKIYNPLGIEPNLQYSYDNHTIISVGRYSSQKGFENLISAFKIVHDFAKEWKLKIIGTDNIELKKLAESLSISKYVEFVSKSENVVNQLNQSSIFVMTSRYEGYANALVEAMACGVPSITYDWLLGADDIIDNNKDGLIVKLVDRYSYAKNIDNEQDIENLASAIIKLINDEDLCKKFSINSNKKIIDTRNRKIIIDKWKKEIEENADEIFISD